MVDLDARLRTINSYITPGIAATEVRLVKNNGLVLYWQNAAKLYQLWGSGARVGADLCLSAPTLEGRGVLLGKQMYGAPFDFIVVSDSNQNTEVFSTICWIKQYPVVPCDFNRAAICCSPTRMAHLLIVCATNGFNENVYDKVREVVESTAIPMRHVYLSGDVHRDLSLHSGAFNKSKLVIEGQHDIEEEI